MEDIFQYFIFEIQIDQGDTNSRFKNDFDNFTQLGEGHFGRVIKARNKLDDTYYAVL